MIYLLVPLLLIYGVTENKILLGITLIYTAIFLFIKGRKLFEELSIEEVVLISILSSIAGVTRVPFAAIPSFQPTTAIIIIVGIVYGRKIGFITGIIAAFVSNIFLGHGPWTPWQMIAWGLCGFFAEYIRGKNKYIIYLYGFLSGILFGWFMNIWHIVGFVDVINIKTIFLTYVSSFYFDLIHGVGNVMFIAMLLPTLYKFLNRIKIKYNILN